jgi:hypothetical protein
MSVTTVGPFIAAYAPSLSGAFRRAGYYDQDDLQMLYLAFRTDEHGLKGSVARLSADFTAL